MVFIIAADKDVNAERFNGLPVIEVPVKEAIHHPAELINKVVSGQAQRQGLPRQRIQTRNSSERESFADRFKQTSDERRFQHALRGGRRDLNRCFLMGIYSADPNSAQYNVIAATLMKVGQRAFSIMVPVFTAYIAWSDSGRPGMVAGFVGGLSRTPPAPVLGGIIAGFAAGYFMLLIRHLLDGLPASVRRAEVDLFYYAADWRPVIGVMMVLLASRWQRSTMA